MTWRHVAAILISVMGVLAPLAVIITTFGTETRVYLDGPASLKQLVYIVVAFLVSFAGSLVGSILYKDRSVALSLEVLRQTMSAWSAPEAKKKPA